MDLKDFFSAAEARSDRWSEMNSLGRAWEAAIAQGEPADKLHTQAAQLLGEISPMENYWAYPGSRLMTTIRETLDEANAGVFARLVQKISNALLTESNGRSWHALSTVGNGTVTLTSISATGAAGTFAFTAPAVASSGATGSKVVTNGSFDVKF